MGYLFRLLSIAALVQLELARVLDFDLLQLDRCGLLDPVHVLVVHVVDLVGGAGCENQHAFQDRDDELSIETSLQKSVHLRLFHDLVELNIPNACGLAWPK